MREARSAFLKRPFPALISHFVNRLFASEEEQGGSSLGFGIGAVLAILASPGAFASIFLMAKYSTLLQWMRGEHIDAIRRSPSDEYFFVSALHDDHRFRHGCPLEPPVPRPKGFPESRALAHPHSEYLCREFHRAA